MGRGVSSGGGQSSLGYLFGSDEPPSKGSPPPPPSTAASVPTSSIISEEVKKKEIHHHPSPAAAAAVNNNQAPPAGIKTPVSSDLNNGGGVNPDIPAGQLGSNPNNYHRADGQNTGNFITDRPSTKVHAAPGGGSSLGYLFGGN